MLMIIFFLIVIILVVMTAAKFFNEDRSRNRYRRKHSSFKTKTPIFTRDSEATVYQETEDADEVLGIKLPENTPVEKSSRNISPTGGIMIFHLLPEPGRQYAGYSLLQTLLMNGLRFGRGHLFHRHLHDDGSGEILFSVAQAVEPGTFDLNEMGSKVYLGLTFFCATSKTENPDKAIDLLIKTIWKIQEELGGFVFDKTRKYPLTADQIDVYQETTEAVAR